MDNNKEVKSNTKGKNNQVLGIVRLVIILALAMGVVLAIFIRFTNNSRNSAQTADDNLSEVDILKLYDMDKDYPKAARDVVKLHCRFLKTLYSENLNDEDMTKLNSQIRMLFSDELLNNNSESMQLNKLKNDAKDFKDAGKLFISYTVAPEDQVAYTEVDGEKYAVVMVTLSIKEGSTTNQLNEEYLLISQDGQWKIVGWGAVESSDNNGN